MVIFQLCFHPSTILVFHFNFQVFLPSSLPLCLWCQVDHSLVITSILEKEALALSSSLKLDFEVHFVVQLDLMTLSSPLPALLTSKALIPPTSLEFACNLLKFS